MRVITALHNGDNIVQTLTKNHDWGNSKDKYLGRIRINRYWIKAGKSDLENLGYCTLFQSRVTQVLVRV